MGQWEDKFNYLLLGDVPPSLTVFGLRNAVSQQRTQPDPNQGLGLKNTLPHSIIVFEVSVGGRQWLGHSLLRDNSHLSLVL